EVGEWAWCWPTFLVGDVDHHVVRVEVFEVVDHEVRGLPMSIVDSGIHHKCSAGPSVSRGKLYNINHNAELSPEVSDDRALGLPCPGWMCGSFRFDKTDCHVASRIPILASDHLHHVGVVIATDGTDLD